MAGIDYLKMKTDRAKEHLDELNRLVDEFIKDAYTVTRKDDIKKERHIIRVEFNYAPYAIGMLAGEFAYNLRSGLDQLAWQLARLNNKPGPPRSATSFPILSSPPPKRFGDKVKDILPAGFVVIESLQPYHRGAAFKSHPLYILNELCIMDKHMVMPVRSTDLFIDLEGAKYFRRRQLDYGFEVFLDLRDKFKAQLKPTKCEIIFGEPISSGIGAFEIRIADFRTIHDFVRDEVIPRFAGFFK